MSDRAGWIEALWGPVRRFLEYVPDAAGIPAEGEGSGAKFAPDLEADSREAASMVGSPGYRTQIYWPAKPGPFRRIIVEEDGSFYGIRSRIDRADDSGEIGPKCANERCGRRGMMRLELNLYGCTHCGHVTTLRFGLPWSSGFCTMPSLAEQSAWLELQRRMRIRKGERCQPIES